MNTKFKVLLIGCGNMAGGYDLFQPEEALPLGHAKAFASMAALNSPAASTQTQNNAKIFKAAGKCRRAMPVGKTYRTRWARLM